MSPAVAAVSAGVAAAVGARWPQRRSLVLYHGSCPESLSLPRIPTLSFYCRFTPRWSSSSPSRRNCIKAATAAAVDVPTADGEIRVTETPMPRSSVKLSVEVPPAICKECYKKTIDEYNKRLKIPGFRPGKKVPENILINYIGRENLDQATIEVILRETLPQATNSVEGRALKESIRIMNKISDLSASFSLENTFCYDVVVDVAPEVRWLSDSRYKNLKVLVEIDDLINAQKASEKELKRRHKELGTLRIVTDRGLQVGDLVVLDIFAESVTDEGSEVMKIPSTERKGFHLDTDESDSLLPGFLDSVIGIRPGETRTFPLQFPDSWEQESLRGSLAMFTVGCKELFYQELPPLDDSLAPKLFPGGRTLDEVRGIILERCKEVEKTAIEQATDNAILDQLSKIAEVEIPQSLFEEQGRQLYGAKLLQLQAEKKLTEEQLASLTNERTVKEYMEFERENISRIIRQMLVVGEIFKCENLQFSTEELVEEVENSVAEFKRHQQEYDEDSVKQQVQDVLEGAKVLEWLRENAVVEYVYR